MGILTGGLWQVGTGICQLFGAENWGDAIFRQMTSDFRQSSSSMEQAKNIPSIQGGSNQNGANQSIPVIIGETYYTPMTIQKSYVCLEPDENNLNDGEDEYFHSTYILGQRDIEVRDINLGIYKITGNNNNISNGTLTIDNDSRFPIEKYKTQLKLNENSFKVVEEDFGNELKNVNGDFVKILPFSARMPKKVQLEFQFSSLVKYNDKNEKENTSVTLGMEYSVDGGNTYKPLEQTGHWGNSNLVTIERVDTENTTSAFYKFTSNQAKVLRYCLVHDFSFDDLQSCCQNGNSCIEIRVWRQSEKNTDTKYQDNVYFTKILTWCVNEKKCFQNGVDSSYNNIWKSFYDVNTFNEKVINEDYFNKITTLEFKIKSGAEVQGTLQALNCIVKAKGKIWNGSTRTWSTDKVVTSNPASMCLMLMQNEWSKKYSYPDSMIDFESFGYLYEYCNYTYSRYVNSKYPSIMNGKQFVVNGVISSQKKLGEYLSLLLGSADSYLVLRGTKYSVFIDTYSMPVMTLNNHNILEASNTKLFKERIHGYKVNFINALNYYQKDTILCVAKKYENIPIDERNILEVEMQFAVDPYRIYDKAMRYIGENELRPEIWNRKVGIDGNLIEIGDMVNIQDDTILSGIGDGAEVIGFEYKNNNKNNLIKIVKTNGKFTITDYRETYVLHYYSKQQKRTHEIPLIFHENGVYSDLEIDDEFSLNSNDIGEGDIVSVAIICGTEMAICFGKKDNGDGTFDLSLVPYRNEIYEVMLGDIPEFKSRISNPKQAGISVSESQVKINDVYEIVKEETRLRSEDIPNTDAVNSNDCEFVLKQSGIYIKVAIKEDSQIEQLEKKDIPVAFEYSIKKGTSANWSERVKVTSTATTYNFLESELYKEKSFFNGWKVRIYTVSSNGNASTNYIEKSIDTSDYGTWTVPQITNLKVTVDSSGNGMRFSWNFERGNFYGTPKYKISYGWKKGSTTTSILTNEETFNTYFDRQFDRTKEQFPEASEFASSIVLKVQSVCDETNTSSSWVNWINTNLITTGYKTWIPSIINGLTAKANKDGSGLTFNWEKQNPSLCYGDVKYKINYKWNNVLKVTNAETQNNYYTRDFVRTSGNEQYPEKADLNSSTSKFNFTVQAVNIQSGKSQSTLTTVTTSDVSDYLTYKPSLKPISINGASRQVFLTLEPTVAHYGEIKYRVRIKRNALTWTTPQNTNQTVNADSSFCIVNDDTSTIYTSETSYKKTLASGETEKLYSSFTQTLPLIGQNYTYNSQSLPSPQSTTYTYEVMLKNITSGYNSSVQTISYTINPTMARDVANSIITENKIATGAITNEKIGTGAITEVKISNNAITNTKISDNAISTSKLQANAITSNKISASAITAEKIATNAVTTAKLSANCVNASKIASSTITADKMAVTDLYAISSKFGKISNNSIAKDEFNYWDLETGDFRIGNSANENSDDAQYFKMSSNSISLKIANFIVKAITSIIKGIFKITQPNSTSSFLVANPYTSAKNPDDNTSESIPAKTVKVNGTVEANIIQNPWQTIDLSSNTYNQDMYYPVVAKSSSGIIELECLLNETRSTITWSTHNQNLIVAYMHLYDIGTGWYFFIKKPLMLENQFRWCTKAPIYYTQMLQSSTFVLFLRGGAKYKIRNSLGLTFSIKTSAYTVSGKTVAPTTDPTISGQDGNGVVSQFYDIINDYNWQDKLNKGISTTGTITSTGKITGNGGIGTTNLTTTGTITSTGKITGNGGIDSKSTLRVLNGTTEKFKVDTTGNVTNTGKLYVNNTTNLNATTNGAVQIGNITGIYLDLDNHRVQAKNNGAVSQLNINTYGGKVLLGNSNSDLELRTNTTNSGTLTSAGLITANNGLQVKSGKSLKVGSDSVPRVVSWSGSTLTIDW